MSSAQIELLYYSSIRDYIVTHQHDNQSMKELCYPNGPSKYQVAAECVRVYNGTALDDCYLSACYHFSKQSYQPIILMCMTIVYGLIMSIGVFGNVTAIIIMGKHKQIKRSTTSRYLINLSVADLTTLLIGMPFEGLISEITSYVSVLTILLFSIERYLGVCHSLRMLRQANYRHRIWCALCIVWIVSFAFALPYGVEHKVGHLPNTSWPNGLDVQEGRMCMLNMVFDNKLTPQFKVLFHLSAVLFFILPLCLIVVLYALIGRAIRQSVQMRREHANQPASSTAGDGDRSGEMHNRKVITMLVVVVTVFFCCYAPFQFQRLSFFYTSYEYQNFINTYVYPISGILFYLSTALNPLVYNIMSTNYRRAFLQLLRCRNISSPNSTVRFNNNVSATFGGIVSTNRPLRRTLSGPGHNDVLEVEESETLLGQEAPGRVYHPLFTSADGQRSPAKVLYCVNVTKENKLSIPAKRSPKALTLSKLNSSGSSPSLISKRIC